MDKELTISEVLNTSNEPMLAKDVWQQSKYKDNIEDFYAELKRIQDSVKEVKNESDLDGYDGYVFGSATYHGEMLQGMKTFLFLAEKANLEGKVGGAFGSFGWSGEANDRIFETMKHILKMDLVGDTLRLKSSSLEGGMTMAQDYGRAIAKKFDG